MWEGIQGMYWSSLWIYLWVNMLICYKCILAQPKSVCVWWGAAKGLNRISDSNSTSHVNAATALAPRVKRRNPEDKSYRFTGQMSHYWLGLQQVYPTPVRWECLWCAGDISGSRGSLVQSSGCYPGSGRPVSAPDSVAHPSPGGFHLSVPQILN